VTTHKPSTTGPQGDTGGLPLNGIRVLDLGMFWAGPFAGKWLADGGAQVIKIESASHPDNLRILARGVYPDGEPGEDPWNRSGMINERNRNKLGIALEMGEPEGRDLFRRLVAVSDIVIENFSTRVMRSWDLDYPRLKEINPRIILASVYSQGATGPESGYVSFGGTLEQLAGITYITGYANEMPGVLTVQLPDPVGGAMATGLILAALRQRRRTGEGTHIDLSQRENVVSLLGAQVLDYSMNGRVTERMGNRDPHMAPHGCYRCDGEDEWVTLAVRNDEEWACLARAIGQDSLIEDPRFATVTARHSNHDELDTLISAWTASRDKIEAMRHLQEAGVAAGAVYTAADLYADPHLDARSFWEPIEETSAGLHRFPGRPGRYSRTPLTTRTPTPNLGQHNEYVFREILGMTASEYADIEARGLIANEPTEAAKRGRL
jgi:crotonobetainyl-CoA:carnitine CoA-transferase CaiB-like acyl-CoA transferase